jgi:hypothetical protein
MRVFLFLVYYAEGFVMALLLCSAIGFALALFLALAKSFSRPKNLLLALMYSGGALVCYLPLFAVLHLASWIGDRTHYVGHKGIVIGAIFPGILSLKIIPHYLRIAAKQTSGVFVD